MHEQSMSIASLPEWKRILHVHDSGRGLWRVAE